MLSLLNSMIIEKTIIAQMNIFLLFKGGSVLLIVLPFLSEIFFKNKVSLWNIKIFLNKFEFVLE